MSTTTLLPPHAATPKATPSTFDAFISYSHTADADLAPALRHGLHQLAKPWYRPRAVKVFMDNASLATNPALWTSITHALDSSRTLVLLCSPEAAASVWVNKEVEHWLTHQSASTILPVLTDGELVWNDAERDFDFARSTAVPHALQGAFNEEPRFLDMRWTKEQNSSVALSLQNSQFKDAVADLAAPIRGTAKDELVGEDIRQHHRTRRLAQSAVAALSVLLIAALVSASIARSNAVRAESRRVDAEARRLGLAATGIAGPPDLAYMLAAEGYRMRPSGTTLSALLKTADAAPQVLHLRHDHHAPVTAMAAQPTLNRVVSVDSAGVLLANDMTTGEVKARATVKGNAFRLLQLAGALLVVTRQGTYSYDTATLRATDDVAIPSDLIVTSATVVAGGLAMGNLGAGNNVDGQLLWRDGDVSETILTGQGAPVAMGSDGDALVVLFSLPALQEASVRRFHRINGKWTEQWNVAVESVSTTMTVDAAAGLVMVGTVTGAVKFLDPTTGRAINSVSVGLTGVRDMAFANGTVLVGDATGAVHWLDARTGFATFISTVHAGPLSSIAVLPNGHYATAGVDGAVVIQQISPFRVLASTSMRLADRGFAVDAQPTLALAYVAHFGGVSKVNLITHRVESIIDNDPAFFSVAVLPGGNVAVGDSTGRIQVLQGTRVVQKLLPEWQTIFTLLMVPGHNELLVLTESGRLAVAPVTKGRIGALRVLATTASTSIAVSPDGSTVAYEGLVPGKGQRVLLLRLSDAKVLGEVDSQGSVERLAFSADGRRLAVAYDGSVKIYDLDPSTHIATEGALVPLTGTPRAVAFDGARSERLVVSDSDSQVTVWDSRTGESLGGVAGYGPSGGADVSHGLATAFVLVENTLLQRDLRTEPLRHSACQVLGRALTEQERVRFDVPRRSNPCTPIK